MNDTHYLYGLHAVQAVLQQQPQQAQLLYVQANRADQRLSALLTLAQTANIAIQTVSRQQLDSFVLGANHQGVVLQCRATNSNWSENDLEQLLDQLQQPAFLLILDGVQDPHNLGACLRTANGAGVHAVIAPKDRAAGLTAAVRKVASGAAESTPFVSVTNLARTMQWLKQRGIWLYGAAGEASQNIYEIDFSGAIGLVLGAEGTGLRRLTADHCDELVGIPMQGTVSSLNVSVAAGVCLYEVVRQRLKSR